MNSIEIAKKLIKENNDDIDDMRGREVELRKRIEELEGKIERQKQALKILESSLAREQDNLEYVQGYKKEYLVNNLALQAFIANGGGLDMLD